MSQPLAAPPPTSPPQGPLLLLLLLLPFLILPPADAAAPYDAQEWGRSRGRSWSTGVPNMVRRVGRCWWQGATDQGSLQDEKRKWWLQEDQGKWRSTTALRDWRTCA